MAAASRVFLWPPFGDGQQTEGNGPMTLASTLHAAIPERAAARADAWRSRI